MEIHKDIQYNQSIGKFKVLSSNAGVGSIVTTKAGFFVMPKSVSYWGFVKDVNKQIETLAQHNLLLLNLVTLFLLIHIQTEPNQFLLILLL